MSLSSSAKFRQHVAKTLTEAARGLPWRAISRVRRWKSWIAAYDTARFREPAAVCCPNERTRKRSSPAPPWTRLRGFEHNAECQPRACARMPRLGSELSCNPGASRIKSSHSCRVVRSRAAG